MLACAGCSSREVIVEIHPDRVLKNVRDHPLGTNVPVLIASPEQSAAAVRAMGARYLRYGDPRYSFWSEPPWQKASPVTVHRGVDAWPAMEREWVQADGIHFRPEGMTDFDEFMAFARSAGAEPLIMTTYNGFYIKPHAGMTIPPKEAFFRAAVEWVRYANVAHQYGIRYWEIGNELWNPKDLSTLKAANVAADLRVLVPRMKAVDPSIKIVVSGERYPWYEKILKAAPQIDYVNFSWYLPRMRYGYESFRVRENLLETSPEFTDLQRALGELKPAERARIGVMITEFNAIDWTGKWPNTNDLGHALCVFQQAGEALSHPQIKLAMHWTTQWKYPYWETGSDDESVYNAVRYDGSLAANGMALAIWGQNLQAEFVAAKSSQSQVKVWATRSDDRQSLNLFVLNKDLSEHSLKLTGADAGYRLVEQFQLVGRDIDDQHPRWDRVPVVEPVLLPSTSVTLLKFQRPTGAVER